MKAWPKVSLGELLRRSDEAAVLDPEAEYHEVTIKLWGRGVVSRRKVRGGDVVSGRRVVRANQLILSKIDVKRYPFDGRHDPARSVIHGRPAWSWHSNTTPAGGG